VPNGPKHFSAISLSFFSFSELWHALAMLA